MRVTKNEEIISSLFYDRFHTFEEMRKPELRHYHESSVMLEDPVGYLQVQKAFSHQRVCYGWKPFEECKGRRELDCDTDGWSRYESRT